MPVGERRSGGGGTILAVGCAIAGAVTLLLVLLGFLGFAGTRTLMTTGPTVAPPPTARMGGSGNWGTSSGMDRSIPDGGTPGTAPVSHTFDVQDAGSRSAIATDVKLKLELVHPRPEDLEVQLRHPDGTVVTLRRAGTPGLLNANYPEADSPAESLAQLQGKPITGKWKVTVRDTRKGNRGRVTSAGLDLSYSF